MGFFDNIFKATGGVFPCDYRITVCGSSGIYVEGVIKILDINEKFIILKIKNGKLTIFGENLKISSFYEKDVVIKGEMLKIEKEIDRVEKGTN